MSDLATFINLGFHHIVNPEALDHILFLLALAAVYRRQDWRDALWVITAFTVGHSITLALAVTGALVLPTPIIEFLIPLTIVVTALENIAVRARAVTPWHGRYRALFTAAFGLVHGAGFANYLRSLFDGPIAIPLFGFNVGIELGQICVLVLTFTAFTAVDRVIAAARRSGDGRSSPVRIRAVAVSCVVLLVATRWAVQRAPW